MQDEINEKVVALSIKGGKLTAATLQKAVKAMKMSITLDTLTARILKLSSDSQS